MAYNVQQWKDKYDYIFNYLNRLPRRYWVESLYGHWLNIQSTDSFDNINDARRKGRIGLFDRINDKELYNEIFYAINEGQDDGPLFGKMMILNLLCSANPFYNGKVYYPTFKVQTNNDPNQQTIKTYDYGFPVKPSMRLHAVGTLLGGITDYPAFKPNRAFRFKFFNENEPYDKHLDFDLNTLGITFSNNVNFTISDKFIDSNHIHSANPGAVIFKDTFIKDPNTPLDIFIYRTANTPNAVRVRITVDSSSSIHYLIRVEDTGSWSCVRTSPFPESSLRIRFHDTRFINDKSFTATSTGHHYSLFGAVIPLGKGSIHLTQLDDSFQFRLLWNSNFTGKIPFNPLYPNDGSIYINEQEIAVTSDSSNIDNNNLNVFEDIKSKVIDTSIQPLVDKVNQLINRIDGLDGTVQSYAIKSGVDWRNKVIR